MPEARTDRAWRRPWVALAIAAILIAASVAIAAATLGDLGTGSLRLVDRPADPAPQEAELYAVLSGDGDPAPDQRSFRISQDVVSAQLQADPAVASVRAERDGDAVILIAGFGDATSAEREEAAVRLTDTVDPGALRVRIGGEIPRQLDDRDELEEELWRNQLLVVPLGLLALIFAVGLRRAAAPVICAALAVAGSLALLGAIGSVADVSVLGAPVAAVVGLVLGIELPLRALRAPEAPERAPRSALTVGAVGALPGFALLATPLDQAGSLALGAALASILAAAATLLIVPALVALSSSSNAQPRAPRLVPRRRALVAFGLAVVALCALAAPVVSGETAPYPAFDRAFGGTPGPDDSLYPELALAAAIAIGVAFALALLARHPLALALGPLSLLPAAAGLGVCELIAAESPEIGRAGFLDTAAVAIAICALAAIGCARSASTAIWLSAGRRLELLPAVVASAIAVLAAAALYATELPQAEELAIAIAAGLAADLLLVRVPVLCLVNGRLGSSDE